MSDIDTTKETAYDEHISPLMTRVIALCKEHKINMAATFALDHNDEGQPIYCTTILHDVDKTDAPGIERMQQCRRVMYPRAEMVAIMVIGGDK
jgi:hypothetical protein